jgi:hypothetical protein
VARKIGTSFDFIRLYEIQNAKIHNLGSEPTGLGSGDKGLVYFNTATNRLRYWNGSSWEFKASDSDLLQGQNGAHYLSRTNHSGTQTSSTISDLAATVQAYRLDQFAAATSPLTAPDATQDTHLITRGQLNSTIAGLTAGQTPKGAVRGAAETNINIASAPATIDDITPVSGQDIFLLVAQTTGTQNGPYTWNGAGSAMTRAANWDTNTEAVLGSYWIVREGTRADQFALLTNDTAITLGTSTPAFIFISAGGAAYSGGAGLTLTGTVFDVVAAANGGIQVNANDIQLDSAVALRKRAVGVIPTATTGVYTVAGAVVTINHQLGNNAAKPHVVFHTSPGAGNTQGEPLEVDYTNSDSNNTVITFPGAPGSNQYYAMMMG